jgi:D-glycero-D-manno-heptose 1,7-bisphosphate phosphatase
VKEVVYGLLNRHIWIYPFSAKKFFEKFFPRKISTSITFLDLDGTLMPDIGPGGLLRGNHIFPAWELIRYRVKDASWVIITNQTCFARKEILKIRDIFKYFRIWISLLRKLRIEAVLVCHHHPHAISHKLRRECSSRKPSGSLITQYLQMKNFDLSTSSLIGDRITDAIAATSAGVKNTILIHNSRMFEESQFGTLPILNYAFFSLLPSPEESSFCREINEHI